MAISNSYLTSKTICRNGSHFDSAITSIHCVIYIFRTNRAMD